MCPEHELAVKCLEEVGPGSERRNPTPTGSIGPIRPLARGAATAPTSSPAVATTRTDTEPVRRRRGSRPSGPAQVGHRHLHCGCGRGVVTRARLIPHPTGDDLDQEGKILSLIHISEPTRRTPISYAV